MIVENPRALTYLLTEDLYLLPGDDVVSPPNKTIIEAADEPDELKSAAVNFSAHGGYKQNFLIVVHYPDHQLMDDNHFAALENTFKRKGLTVNDIGIINLALYHNNTFDEINDFFKPKKLLILGKPALPAASPVPVLNVITTLNNCQTLYSYSFNEMMGNKDKTRAFWEQVKNF